MKKYIQTYKGADIGWVSSKTPLLSNLNILENVAIIEESRYFIDTEEALKNARETLKKIDSEKSILKRVNSASENEIFCAQLARASLLKEGKILIITPFTLLHDTQNIEYILGKIDQLNIRDRCEIIDIKSRRHQYQQGEDLCLIEK